MNRSEIKQLFREGATDYIIKAKDSVKQLKSVIHKIFEIKEQKLKSRKTIVFIILFWVIFTLLFLVILFKNANFLFS